MKNYKSMESEFGSLEHGLYKFEEKFWRFIEKKNKQIQFAVTQCYRKQKSRDHPPCQIKPLYDTTLFIRCDDIIFYLRIVPPLSMIINYYAVNIFSNVSSFG